MSMKIFLVFVIGCLSIANTQNSYCSGDFCFIRPDPNSGKTWSSAQQLCKDNNATLPIADDTNSRMSFIDALNHFQLNGNDVWLGATASDDGPMNWRWLDGSQYSGTDVQQMGEYYKSYAYVAKISGEVLAYASAPNVSYSYICQCKTVNPDICTNGTGRTAFVKDNRCFMRYDEKLSWFNARNKCLATSCDLASVTQLSLLDGMVDSSGSWVGLRTSQWNWQNAVTGLSSDVTFTSWTIGQPNDGAPDCMATNSGDFPNWKDTDCAYVYQYICQVSDIRASTTTRPTPARFIRSSTASSTTTKSALGTPGTDRTGASATTSTSTRMSPLETPETARAETNATSSNVPLGIGLGVGLGVPVIIVVVVITIVLRRKHQNRQLGTDGANFKAEIANSTEISTSSPTSVLPTVESDANDHYQQLKNSHELQEQQQYEELQQAPQYEQLQRRNELQEQLQYEQLPQNPQYEQL